MALKDALLAEFDHEIATTRRLFERIPDDRLSWRPHPRSRTLGELATHISHLPEWGITILNDSSYDIGSGPPSLAAHGSRAQLLERFDQMTAKTRAALDRTDAEYMGTWTLKRDGHEVFTMPRIAALRSFALNHLIHHRGQLSVYLRLNEVPVPAIYGPSADEGR
jgi:uncharacterized damage-inducible protein DinB